jgi:hypothetical protein
MIYFLFISLKKEESKWDLAVGVVIVLLTDMDFEWYGVL